MGLLSRDEILNAEDRPTEEVDLSDLPGYNGAVRVRGMSGRERDAFEVSMRDQRTGRQVPGALSNIRAKVVARCVVDDDGDRMFTDSDITALGEKSGAMVDRVFDVASRLSGMSDKDQQEMTANFGQASGEDSSSPSPPASTRQPKNSSRS